MKVIIPTLAVIAILAAPAPVQAQSTYTNTDGGVYTYNTNKDGSANITSYAGPPWVATIPTNIAGLTVGSIGSSAFYNTNELLTSVSIPGCVTNIGTEAFFYCTNLTNATIAYGVTTIGLAAFNECTGLTSITIPGSVISTGTASFDECTSLGSVTIANGVTKIDSPSFAGCTSLTNVIIGNTVVDIGNEAFFSCANLSNIIIPRSVTTIESDAFDGCHGLAGVYFVGNAPAVGSQAFGADTNATAYYLPGTTGWTNFSAGTGLPTVLWNPLIQTADGNFGVRANKFGFTITGTNNFTIAVEACTNLANPVWTPLSTVTLTNGSFYFTDPQWANYRNRYYGLGLP